MELNGRTIDISCPNEGYCFGNMGCYTACPPTLLDVLKNTAELEHECELLPHTDPDLKAVCPICVGKPRFEPPEYDYVLS